MFLYDYYWLSLQWRSVSVECSLSSVFQFAVRLGSREGTDTRPEEVHHMYTIMKRGPEFHVLKLVHCPYTHSHCSGPPTPRTRLRTSQGVGWERVQNVFLHLNPINTQVPTAARVWIFATLLFHQALFWLSFWKVVVWKPYISKSDISTFDIILQDGQNWKIIQEHRKTQNIQICPDVRHWKA